MNWLDQAITWVSPEADCAVCALAVRRNWCDWPMKVRAMIGALAAG